MLWLRFYPRQDMRTLFSGLEEAFVFFGGVTEELLFDQMKAVITKDLRLHGGHLVLNLEFLRFARHWGFTPRACRPYRAQTKGKIERPIFYVRDNFVYGRDFLGDGDLDEQRLRWLEQTANVRVHQTIMEQPLVRFERDERVHMKRLAEHPYQSLVLLDSGRKPERMPAGTPRIEVERRSLVTYARIAAGAR
jgi:transposase